MTHGADRFPGWFAALETRHLADRTFAEVRRGLVALSSLYVRRGRRLETGGALEGEGKRAAFALFYAPLHFLVVRGIVRALGAASPAPSRIVDLGCGTGTSGAAWAIEAGVGCRVDGVERSGWAAEESIWNYRVLDVAGRVRRGDLGRAELPGARAGVLAAYTVNELADDARARLLPRLLEAARRGARVLVVEPIARRPFPWWDDWSDAFRREGGRENPWRFAVDLPERLRLLDRAAGLDHRELTGRSLYLEAPGRR